MSYDGVPSIPSIEIPKYTFPMPKEKGSVYVFPKSASTTMSNSVSDDPTLTWMLTYALARVVRFKQ